MKISRFTPPFSLEHLPLWACSNCDEGILSSVGDSYKSVHTARSEGNYVDGWDPTWEKKRFSLMLRCTKCNDPVFCVGDAVQIEHETDERSGLWYEELIPTYFEPPLSIIALPLSCPDTISQEIRTASALYWGSPSSSGGRLRAAVERLMDELKIDSKHSLDARLKEYQKISPDLGNKLLAIKWIGNVGSHGDELDNDNVLDAFVLIEHVLDEIYNASSKRFGNLADAIVAKKGRGYK